MMKASDAGAFPIVMDREGESPFMRLPTEVREMIYQYLLIAKYTATEHNMNSKEVSLSYSRVLRVS